MTIKFKNHPQALTEQEIKSEIESAVESYIHENRYSPAFDYLYIVLEARYKQIEAKMLENEPEIDGFFGEIERFENAYKKNPKLGKELDRVRCLISKRLDQLSKREQVRINALTINEIEMSLP